MPTATLSSTRTKETPDAPRAARRGEEKAAERETSAANGEQAELELDEAYDNLAFTD